MRASRSKELLDWLAKQLRAAPGWSCELSQDVIPLPGDDDWPQYMGGDITVRIRIRRKRRAPKRRVRTRTRK